MKVKIGKFPKEGSRKIEVHIDNYDTWSLDHTLALIIYPALIQLKNSKHGVPNNLIEDIGGENWGDQISFDFYSSTYDDMFEVACKRWDEILDKMIWSFEQVLKDNYDQLYHHGTIDYEWKETDKLYPDPVTGKLEPAYQMVDKYPDQHWYDLEGHKLHEERIQEGLELFGKYYQSLWD